MYGSNKASGAAPLRRRRTTAGRFVSAPLPPRPIPQAPMSRNSPAIAVGGGILAGSGAIDAALAQKPGGILRMYSPDSPSSMSIHEEATVFAEGPMMGVFNNLVIYDQHVPQNSLASIVPDLATGWSWNEDGTAGNFPFGPGGERHHGHPLTAQDVVASFYLLTGN